MTYEEFNELLDAQVSHIKEMLVLKAGEYNLEEDRLGFFKRAASIIEETPEQALYGFMLKHFMSISDMIADGKKHPIALWKEKITDLQNYLFLLLGLVSEGEEA